MKLFVNNGVVSILLIDFEKNDGFYPTSFSKKSFKKLMFYLTRNVFE